MKAFEAGAAFMDDNEDDFRRETDNRLKSYRGEKLNNGRYNKN